LHNYLDLKKLVLPQFLVDYFDLVNSKKKLHLFFEEPNIVPKKESSPILITQKVFIKKSLYRIPHCGATQFTFTFKRSWIDKQTRDVIERLKVE